MDARKVNPAISHLEAYARHEWQYAAQLEAFNNYSLAREFRWRAALATLRASKLCERYWGFPLHGTPLDKYPFAIEDVSALAPETTMQDKGI